MKKADTAQELITLLQAADQKMPGCSVMFAVEKMTNDVILLAVPADLKVAEMETEDLVEVNVYHNRINFVKPMLSRFTLLGDLGEDESPAPEPSGPEPSGPEPSGPEPSGGTPPPTP